MELVLQGEPPKATGRLSSRDQGKNATLACIEHPQGSVSCFRMVSTLDVLRDGDRNTDGGLSGE